MKWIVGLDLRPSSQGAIAFGRWLAETSGDRVEPDSLVGVHVIEREQLAPVFRLRAPEQVLAEAQSSAEKALKEAHAIAHVGAVDVVVHPRADEGLAHEAKVRGADGLIVARRENDGEAVIRLGPVSHRLVRSLPAPLIVTPNDLTYDAIGDGPIIVATDLEAESGRAAQVGQELAKIHDRPMLLVHVVPDPEQVLATYARPFVIKDLAEEHRVEGAKALETWAKEFGITRAEQRVVMGSTIDALCDLVLQERAPLLVVGSRRLSRIERLFMSSTGTQLAATAPCPVAIVATESG